MLADLLPLTILADLRRAWPWPQRRLSYANAAVAEAVLAAGQWLADDKALALGLGLLGWLLELQTFDGHLSVVPATGWGAGESRHDLNSRAAGPAYGSRRTGSFALPGT